MDTQRTFTQELRENVEFAFSNWRELVREFYPGYADAVEDIDEFYMASERCRVVGIICCEPVVLPTIPTSDYLMWRQRISARHQPKGINMERITHFRPAFDKRNPDPSKDCGVGAVTCTMVLKGDDGAVHFMFSTGIYLPHVDAELRAKGSACLKPMGHDVCYHSPRPMYEGQDIAHVDCEYTGGACYYGSCGPRAQEWMKVLIQNGSEAIWAMLEEEYNAAFCNNTEGNNMLEQLTKEELHNIAIGDYRDNCEVDAACARRLLHLCQDYGEGGQEAKALLEMALKKIDVIS